jgi:chromate transporter
MMDTQGMHALAWYGDIHLLSVLFAHFLVLSLLSVGGAITVLPDMHRILVDELNVLTDAQFAASMAIAQAAPGPNILFVAVMGFQAGGLAAMAGALAGIMLPPALLACAAQRWMHARRELPWMRAFRAGMAPLVVALMLSSAWLLASNMPDRLHHGLAAAAAIIAWRTRVHLLLLLASGALAGMLAAA